MANEDPRRNPEQAKDSGEADLSKVPNPPVEELSDEQLDNVTGGASLTYSKIEFSYKPQSSD
jgi:bacteriocin-like protein